MSLRFIERGAEDRRVLLDLFGPSNSGKTYSALLIAEGIVSVVGGSIAMIDTEGRGNLYEDEFTFDRFVLDPPFTPDAFMAAYEELDARYSVIITDTSSDEYEGIGGLLEMAEAQNVKNEVAKWARPKAAHRKLMARIRQLRAQHIFCMRAEDKIEIAEGVDANGKPTRVVRPLGWMRVAEKKWKYDMTVSLFFPPGAAGKARIDKNIGALDAAFQDGAPVTREYGIALARWAQSGAEEVKQLVSIISADGEVLHQSNDPRTLASHYRSAQKLARDKAAFAKANLGALYTLADSGKFRNGSLEDLRKEIAAGGGTWGAQPVDEAELVGGEA